MKITTIKGLRHHGLPPDAMEIMEHFGGDAFKLNDHEKEFIRVNAGAENYFFMRTREDRRMGRGICTTCGKMHTLLYGRDATHNDTFTCPHCGKRLIVKHAWRLKRVIDDDTLFYLYRPSVINPEVVTCRAVYLCRTMPTLGDWKVKYTLMVDSFYVFEPGKGATQIIPAHMSRITYAEWYIGAYCEKYAYRVKQKKASWRDAQYDGEYSGYGRHKHTAKITCDVLGAYKAAIVSPLYYGMSEYAECFGSGRPFGDYFIRFWDWSARYPSVEKLVKIGLGWAIYQKMMCLSSGNASINWRGKTLTEILRRPLTKQDKRYLLKHGSEIEFYDIGIWQRSRRMSMEEAHMWSGCSYRIKRIALVMGDDAMDRILSYIKRQSQKVTGSTLGGMASDYYDYINGCRKLGRDLAVKETMMPKNLVRAHDDVVKDVSTKENADHEREFEEHVRKYGRKYKLDALGLTVVIPKCGRDLIDEGMAQHNCVATYISRVAKGMSDIVFVRHADDIETSYITMEIHDGRVIQARTKFNAGLDEQGEAFVKLFEKKLAERRDKTA